MKYEITINVIIIGIFCTVLAWYYGRATEGSHAAIRATDSFAGGQTADIWKITAYCPCERCCGAWSDGFTASGARAEGKLIAAPKDIPFGTWIDIEGYGYAEVLDRGSAITGKRLDVFFSDTPNKNGHQLALEWGVRYIEIKI